MDPEIVDRIYECSFVPELWRGVLGELAEIAAARAGFLFIFNGNVHDHAASTDVGREAMTQLVSSGWIAHSERLRRLLGSPHAGFLVEHDLYRDDELAADPFYRDMLYPRGLGWAVATAIRLPTGDWFSITLEREYRSGPAQPETVGKLDQLRPHLARSALLAARLQLERARVASQTLAAIGLPALVLNENLQVLAANDLIEAMGDYVQWRAHDRVALKDRRADRLLRDAVAACASPAAPGVSSFPVRVDGSTATAIAHVVPIRLSARDIFARCAAAVVLTPVTAPQAPPVELIRSLFDLTPAEARVARGLAAGETVEHLAASAAVAPSTIRTHVRGVLAKTGLNRQTDVVALLTGIWSPRPPEQN